MSLGKLWCVSLMCFFHGFLSWISFSLSLSSFFLYHFSQFFYKEGALHFTSYAITHDIFLLVHDCSVGVTWSNTPQLKLRSVQWFTPWNIPQFSNLTFNLMKVFIYIEFKMREHFDIFREEEKYFSVSYIHTKEHLKVNIPCSKQQAVGKHFVPCVAENIWWE